MAKRRLNRDDSLWLGALGLNLRQKIHQKGFKSPYDFWIQALGDDVSRASLNYILNGSVDVKATTLKRIAEALQVDHHELLKFEYPKK